MKDVYHKWMMLPQLFVWRTAALRYHPLRITYNDGKGGYTTRWVLPRGGFTAKSGHRCLRAVDLEKNEFRTFRAAQLVGFHQIDTSVTIPPAQSAGFYGDHPELEAIDAWIISELNAYAKYGLMVGESAYALNWAKGATQLTIGEFSVQGDVDDQTTFPFQLTEKKKKQVAAEVIADILYGSEKPKKKKKMKKKKITKWKIVKDKPAAAEKSSTWLDQYAHTLQGG